MSESGARAPSQVEHDLAIILVAYQAAETIKRCLPTVLDHLNGVSCEVILVDNDSRDGTADHVRSQFPGVRVIEMGWNAGFARANNAGIAASSARHALLLNTDVIFEDDLLGAMVEHLDAHPDVAAVTPAMVDGEGRALAPGRALPRWWTPVEGSLRELFAGVAPRVRGLLNRLAGRQAVLPADGGHEKPPADADWVAGACMMISGEALARVGKLDERFFVFFEDVEWCTRARKAGLRVQVLPSLRVIHLVGGGKRRSVAAMTAYVEAEFLYHKLHDPWGCWFVRGVLLARQLAALALMPLTTLLGRARPGERQARMALVRGLLSPGWTPSGAARPVVSQPSPEGS